MYSGKFLFIYVAFRSACQKISPWALVYTLNLRKVKTGIRNFCQLVTQLLPPATKPKCTLTWAVDVFGQFEGVAVGQVSIGRSYSQDQTVCSSYKLHNHATYLLLNVWRLVPYRDFGHTREIYQGQIQYCNTTGEWLNTTLHSHEVESHVLASSRIRIEQNLGM